MHNTSVHIMVTCMEQLLLLLGCMYMVRVHGVYMCCAYMGCVHGACTRGAHGVCTWCVYMVHVHVPYIMVGVHGACT